MVQFSGVFQCLERHSDLSAASPDFPVVITDVLAHGSPSGMHVGTSTSSSFIPLLPPDSHW